MSRTEVQLAKDVLLDLNIIPAEGTPSAADQAYVIARYEQLMAEETVSEMVYWPANAIPDAVYLPVVAMVCLVVKGAFGRQTGLDELTEGLRILRQRLRRVAHVEPSKTPTEALDF